MVGCLAVVAAEQALRGDEVPDGGSMEEGSCTRSPSDCCSREVDSWLEVVDGGTRVLSECEAAEGNSAACGAPAFECSVA